MNSQQPTPANSQIKNCTANSHCSAQNSSVNKQKNSIQGHHNNLASQSEINVSNNSQNLKHTLNHNQSNTKNAENNNLRNQNPSMSDHKEASKNNPTKNLNLEFELQKLAKLLTWMGQTIMIKPELLQDVYTHISTHNQTPPMIENPIGSRVEQLENSNIQLNNQVTELQNQITQMSTQLENLQN